MSTGNPSSDAAANALGQAHDFGDETLRVAAVGEIVAVAAMVGADHVAVEIESGDDTRGDGLLADAGVHGAAQLPLAEEIQQVGLDRSDQRHRLVHGPQRAAIFEGFQHPRALFSACFKPDSCVCMAAP